MLSSLFFRLLRLMITSIICSLPIYLGYLVTIPDNGILFLSFFAFVIAIGFNTYIFSFDFCEMKYYYIGLLLPLVIYIVMGFLACLCFPPVVFNRIFLPLRFAGCFGMRTIESIAVISVVFIVMVTALRFWGARSGYLFYEMDSEENEDL